MDAPPDTTSTRQAAYRRAVDAWNRDNGPIEKTVNAGEDLYFAADNLIDFLKSERDELLEACKALLTAVGEHTVVLEFMGKPVPLNELLDTERGRAALNAANAAIAKAEGAST